MNTVKKERNESIIQRELAKVIQTELNDPSLDFVSVTDVELSNDFSYATVYVSFLKDGKSEAGMKALDKANGLLRSKVAKVLTTRRTPELIFKIDESILYGAKIENLLSKIGTKDDE